MCVYARVHITVNAKNNFGDTLDAMYDIDCARSVCQNVGLLLKNSYVVSDNFDLALFLGNANARVDMQLQWIFGIQN